MNRVPLVILLIVLLVLLLLLTIFASAQEPSAAPVRPCQQMALVTNDAELRDALQTKLRAAHRRPLAGWMPKWCPSAPTWLSPSRMPRS